MEFTPEDIMNRMESYARYAHQIKEIKDLLLDFEIYGDEELIEASMRHQDDLIQEIRSIYHERMIPIVEEMAMYVRENMHILMEPAQQQAIQEEPVDRADRSKENALDMGNSLLTTILNEMVRDNDR
jgi:hypothetical protein